MLAFENQRLFLILTIFRLKIECELFKTTFLTCLLSSLRDFSSKKVSGTLRTREGEYIDDLSREGKSEASLLCFPTSYQLSSFLKNSFSFSLTSPGIELAVLTPAKNFLTYSTGMLSS